MSLPGLARSGGAVRTLAVLLSLLLAGAVARAQSGGDARSELLIQSDTVEIAPSLRPVAFRFFRGTAAYAFDGGRGRKEFGRFEARTVGDPLPFQSDTVAELIDVDFKDANFDGYLDLAITVNVGASGGRQVDFYLFDRAAGRFRPVPDELRELSDPEIDPEDSTIHAGGTCCQGRMGDEQVWKLTGGRFQLVKSSSYSEGASRTELRMGDTLVTTSRSVTVTRADGHLVDSSWDYLFGRLRLSSVVVKSRLGRPPTAAEDSAGVAYADVMGSFLYESEETITYERTSDARIRCTTTRSRTEAGAWVDEQVSERFVEE